MSATFTLPSLLLGEQLVLRPLVEHDRQALFQAASDPLIWTQNPSPLRYQREVFEREVFDPGLASGNALIVLDRQTQEVIGSSRYYDIQADSLAIGYTFLIRRCWGGVFNRELKRLMLDHAFESVPRVWFHVAHNNWRSRQAMGKIGGQLSHMHERATSQGPMPYAYFYIDRTDQHGLP
jgi:RimJ/RimL family protein N-acetyltransferase